MSEMPYLKVIDEPFRMKGPGAPRDTVFGVLGKTKEDNKTRSLGGLVANSKPSAPIPKGNVEHHPREMTERHILGPPSKTKIPGSHFGQVPFPGQFMSALGKSL
jgi:hypothetical protein